MNDEFVVIEQRLIGRGGGIYRCGCRPSATVKEEDGASAEGTVEYRMRRATEQEKQVFIAHGNKLPEGTPV